MRSEPLTRQGIVDAALAWALTDGLGSLSTRRLADELGVTPMALYRHVQNKDEIVDAVVDLLLAGVGPPAVPGSDWRRRLEAQARGLRGLFRRHPIAVEVFARQPVTNPAALGRLTSAVEVLQAAGFARDDAVRAFAAVHTYTVGFCALEAGRAAAAAHQVAAAATSADIDVATIRAFVSDEQFSHGLRALLAGLQPTKGSGPR